MSLSRPRWSGCGLAALLALGISFPGPVGAQDFTVSEPVLGVDGRLQIHFPASTSDYHRLLAGSDPALVSVPIGLTLADSFSVSLVPGNQARFFRVERVPRTASLDSDADGIPDVYELEHSAQLDGLNATDATKDPDGDGRTALQEYQDSLIPAVLTTIASTSPLPGDNGVSVNRETVINFSAPLAADALVTRDNFFAGFAGRKFLSRVELSSDRRKATLFYLEPIPGSTRISVVFDATGIRDAQGRLVDADADGVPGGTHVFQFDTYSTTTIAGTAISGVIFASEPTAPRPDGSTNQPLIGVTVTVDGAEESLRAVTDAQGRFTLTNCPAGRFFVHVDGRTSPLSAWPGGAYYPSVGKAWTAVAGRSDNLAPGDGIIYLPLVPAGSLKPVSLVQETEVHLAPSVVATNPTLAGVRVMVPANSLYDNDGRRGGMVGIALVDPKRLPEPLPRGVDLSVVITVQTDGGQNFARPVPVCFPNLPSANNEGSPLPPGTRAVLMSFNHDTGRWETVGPMTVSADGQQICTDAGVGIRQPGWHGPQCPVPVNGPPPPPLVTGSPGTGTGGFPDHVGDCKTVSDSGCQKKADADGMLAERMCEAEYDEKVRGGLTAAQMEKAAEARDLCIADARTRRRQANDKCSVIRCSGGGGGGAPQEKRPVRNSPDAVEQVSALYDEIGAIFRTSRAEGREPTAAELAEINALLDQVRTITGPDSAEFWAIAQAEAAAQVATLDLYSWSAPAYSVYRAEYLVADRRDRGTISEFMTRVRTSLLRSPTEAYGQYQVFPLEIIFGVSRPPDRDRIENWFYDSRTHSVGRAGTVYFRGAQAGKLGSFDLVPLVARPEETAPLISPAAQSVLDIRSFDENGTPGLTREIDKVIDFIDEAIDRGDGRDVDQDGLPDLAEFIVGTDPLNPDSDGDGILDGAELDQGSNPLDGRPVSVGVIGSVPLPGETLDVAAFNDRAVVALGAAGVGVVEVTAGETAVLLAQLAAPGAVLNVALSQEFAVAGGNFFGPLVFDPRSPAATLRRLDIPGNVTAAAVEGGVGWIATASLELHLVDLAAGAVLDTVRLPNAALDIALEDGVATVVFNGELLTFEFRDGRIAPLGRAALELVAPDPLTQRRRVVVGDGVAYVSDRQGFGRFSLTNPVVPVKLSTSEFYGPRSFKQILPNGSGAGLAVAGLALDAPTQHHLQAFDLRDAAVNTAGSTVFNTPGLSHAAALYNNLAYVADGLAGLQILNYVASDTGTNAPGITLRTSLADGKAEAGQLLRLRASVTDDVQVRQVEFYRDGQRVAVDGNFPFEVAFTAPTLTATKTNLLVRARAIDTAGNATWSEELVLELVPDAQPPRVLRTLPDATDLLAELTSVVVLFSEPLNPATVTEVSVRLMASGPDRALGTADDVPVANLTREVREQIPALVLRAPTALPVGSYRLVLSSGVTDLAGNPLASPFTADFGVYDTSVDSDQDGLADDVEVRLGLNPVLADSNSNGVPDGAEDLDGDGLTNAFELAYGLDPRRKDSDRNGVNDGDEDPDRDGLSNLREQAAGSNPRLADSDGDGWSDEAEVTVGSNPASAASTPLLPIVSQPPVEVIAPRAVFGAGLRFGPTLAQPPVEVLLPRAVFGSGITLGTTLAQPPVEVILPRAVTGPGIRLGLTVAQPPVEVILPRAVFGPGISLGLTLAQPPVEVIAPRSVSTGLSAPGTTLARPPLAIGFEPQ